MVILISSKIFLYTSIFLLYIIRNKICIFTKKLAYIVIDKAYLVWRTRSFRKNYVDLGILYYYYSKVLLIALSTILTFNTLEYIYKSLNIHDIICLYKRPIDHPNIMQIIAKIKNSKEFNKLVFLVPTADTVSAIPKIIIFVNSSNKKVTLANYL